MAITLNYVTIHKLNKDKSEPIQASTIREELFPADSPSVIRLITNISQLYGKRNNSAQYGVFINGEGSGIFPDKFATYYENDERANDDFHALSVDTMTSLFRSASNINFATGGYIVFADYQNDQGVQFLLIAMIKQKDGVSISGELNLEELQYIDESKLYQAVRINFSKYFEYINTPPDESHEGTYLSFISPKGTNAGYFVKSIGCESGSPSTMATKKIVSETVAFFKADETLKEHAKEIKRDVIQYLHEVESSEVHRTAKLSELEPIVRRYIPADDAEQAEQTFEALHTKLNSEVGIPAEFNVSKSAMKGLTYIHHNDPDFKIDFKKETLGTGADNRFRYHNETLIIKDLPNELKEQILAQINETES